ncbi:MAG: DUF1697 domain-containing protein [Pseudomonadales bacterium]|nr:DUF1697 domain-containing protein [Pseudomonadales bacterium]
MGGKNSLPMKELAAILEKLGFTNVRTYIQSGNVVFEASHKVTAKDSERIVDAINAAKGFAPHTLILTQDSYRRAFASNPFPVDEGKHLHCFFLDRAPARPDVDRLNRLKGESEAFLLSGTFFYLFAPDGIGRSKLAPAVESALGVPATARNWNTVQKLASMLEGG